MSLEPIRAPELLPINLVAEGNCRISNHLTFIATMLRAQGAEFCETPGALTNGQAQLALEEFGTRLEAVAKVHGLLVRTASGGPIAVDSYLGEIAEGIVSGLSKTGQVRLRRQLLSDCVLPADEAILLGFLISELVTNAVQYAHPAGVAGSITIAASRQAGFVEFDVYDDGVGLPDGFDPHEGGGVGLRMARAFAARLGATLSFDSYGLGLDCVVRLPCDEGGRSSASVVDLAERRHKRS